jgi:hypothetical protein
MSNTTAPEAILSTRYGQVVVRFYGFEDRIAPLAIVQSAAPAHVTVHRVAIQVTYLRLRDYGEGFEAERDKHGQTFNALLASRADRWGESASRSACSKLVDELALAVRAYVADHPEVIEDAERVRLELAIERVSADLADLHAKTSEKVAELQMLLARREGLPSADA